MGGLPAGFPWGQELPLLAPWPLIVLANLGLRRGWARSLTLVVLAALAAAAAILGLLDLAAAGTGPRQDAVFAIRGGIGLIVTGALAGLSLTGRAQRALARALPIEAGDPVHTTAICGSILLAGFFVATQLSTNVLAEEAAASPVSIPGLIGQELPFLVAALLGVGLLVRRGPAGALERLGVVRPRAWHLVLGLAVAGVLYAIGNGIDFLGQAIDPQLMRRVGKASQQVFGGLDTPAGIATLALLPAVCEEALFRGALQPRLGIVWVAALFATFHMQYGLSFDMLAVFVLACGLGLVRRFANTTASMTSHAAYNALVGVGLAGIWLPLGIAVELGLIALLLGGWTRARMLARSSGGVGGPL